MEWNGIMSILLHESGAGSSSSGTVSTATAATPTDDGNSASVTVENSTASKEACTGECQYGRNWKQFVEKLTQKSVIDVDDEKGVNQTNGNDEPPVLPENQASKPTPQQRPQQHNEHVFPLKCCCQMCLASRETVMQLYAEDFQYNLLWDRLQLLMKQYYDLIPESEDNALYNQYMELINKSSLKWLTDARFNRKNIIQMSLASNLPLSNEMAFVMLANVLSTRDPHQLFELLCLQLRSIVQVYYVGFETLFNDGTGDGARHFNVPAMLNYMVNGYKKLCQSARTVAPLLCVLEQRHLGKFGLSWYLINQRIFQRYFYYEVQSILPECMIRLPNSMSGHDHQELLGRFIKFDKEMTDISLGWAEVWPQLYNYHRTQEDCERRHRINTVHTLMQAIRASRFATKSPELFVKPERPIADWLKLENRKLVWEYVVHSLKTKWIPCVKSRLATVADVNCPSCTLAINTHHMECLCETCIIGGGIFTYRPKKDINEQCLMCTCVGVQDQLAVRKSKRPSPFDRLPPGVNGWSLPTSLSNGREGGKQNGSVESAADDKQEASCLPFEMSLAEGEDLYHIAWAIFKHIPDRMPYTWDSLEPARFCTFQRKACNTIACRVAVNIVAMHYPPNLTRLLINSYQPNREEQRRLAKDNWNKKARNSLRKFCVNVDKRWHDDMDDQMHPLLFVDMFWSPQNAALNMPKTRASELAEWFMFDMKAPAQNVFYKYFLNFFDIAANDVVFNLERFERDRVRRERLARILKSTPATTPADPTTLPSASVAPCLSKAPPKEPSCTPSTASAPSVATVASSVNEPSDDCCVSSGRGDYETCTCTCNRCVNDLLSKTEILSQQLDTPKRDSWTQRTNMLGKELKALLKERNMLKEKKKEMGDPQAGEVPPSLEVVPEIGTKDALNVETDAKAVRLPMPDVVSDASSAIQQNATKDVAAASNEGENVNSSSSEAVVISEVAKSPATSLVAPSKASQNNDDQSANPKPPPSCPQAGGSPAPTPPSTAAADVQNPAKLTTFAKRAVGAVIGDISPKPVPSNKAATLKPKCPATAAPAHGCNKPCPCGIPAHAAAAKGTAKPKTATPTSSTTPRHAGCTHSSEDHKKACLRQGGANAAAGGAGGEKAEGSCVCYYCTLFGQSECNHNQKTNETREKLRKKLQKQQMMNDKMFNEEKQKQQQLPPPKDSSVKGTKVAAAGVAANAPTVVPQRPVNKASSTANVTLPAEKGNKKTNKAPGPVKEGRYDQSIDDLLRYIEGDDKNTAGRSTDKKAGGKSGRVNSTEKNSPKTVPAATSTTSTGANTAAKSSITPALEQEIDAKKAKLNASLKRFGELDFLRQLFYDCQNQERKAQELLQSQPGLSKKERKELLVNIQAYRQQKNDLHAWINMLVSNIRSDIPEYPFKLDTFLNSPTSLPSPRSLAQRFASDDAASGGRKAPMESMPPPPTANFVQSLSEQEHQARLKALLHQQPQQAMPNDPTGRQMVTIKRTFLSHAEPQVTVTAKGDSPDQDQVLYTFVNGQVVPLNGPPAPGNPLPANAKEGGTVSGGGKEKMGAAIGNNLGGVDEPSVIFSPQEQRLIQQYMEQLYQQPLDPVLLEQLEQCSIRGSANEEDDQRQMNTMNELIKERMLLRNVELIKNLQKDRKGNSEMLSFANKIKKNLLERQKTQKGATVTNGESTVTANNNASTTPEAIPKVTPVSENRQGGKTKPAPSANAGKAKPKKERKKDKLIDEIDEIVARLNLLDSDEEAAKPVTKRKQKSSQDAKGLNRKQSKDSIVSSGSAKSSSKTTKPSSGAVQEKPNQSQEAQPKKKETPVIGTGKSSSVKEETKKPANVGPTGNDKGKASQPTATAEAVEPAPKSSVRKKVPKTLIDPEFDNNTFRLLNMDESESEVEEDEKDETQSQDQEEDIRMERDQNKVLKEKEPIQQGSDVRRSSREIVSTERTKPCDSSSDKPKKGESAGPEVEQTSGKKNKQTGQTSSTQGCQKPTSESEKKGTQKKQNKQERESKPPATSSSKQQKRDEIEVAGKGASGTTKKLTPAQAMVEKISALLDSPGLSNRQRKQMIRQLEQAQATIQSQLLQNSARAAKAKVQAQAQQEKIANQQQATVQAAPVKAQAREPAGKVRQPVTSNTEGSASNGQTSVGGTGTNSLMDQLRRGIRAEGLDLPPGITLTRLDAIQSEALRLRRESIRKICEPMKPVSAEPVTPALAGAFGGGSPMAPGMFVVNPMSSPVPTTGQQDSVIMVNTGKLRAKEEQQPTHPVDRKKRNKRRSKNKNKDPDVGVGSISASVPGGPMMSKRNDGSNIVTLRNPMFHSGLMGPAGAMRPPPNATGMADVQGARMTLGYDQPATIFKNDNGMFTIRNPALHHALSGGAPPEASGFRPFNAAYLVENGIMTPAGSGPQPAGSVPLVTAAVSSGAGSMMAGGSNVPPYLQQYASPALDDGMEPRKCKSVIGSEMKNAQKQKQNSMQQGVGGATARSWQHLNGTATGHDLFVTPTSAGESQYSSFHPYNLSGPASMGSGVYGSGILGSSGYYSGPGTGVTSKGAVGGGGVNAIGSERSHGGLSYLGGMDGSGCGTSNMLATHCCDDEPPSAFFNGVGLGGLSSTGMGSMNRYDDISFLQNLQPGQRLNSEVTIHSINESKMRRQQAQNYTHDIQITAIPAASPNATAPMGGVLSLQQLKSTAQKQALRAQQGQLPGDGMSHLSDHSPGSGSMGSGSGSGTKTGVGLSDFMDSRASVGSNSSASVELDAKSFLREYQLGQLQQQMQDLKLQAPQQQQQLCAGEYGDTMFGPNEPTGSVEPDERELESLERFNYLFNASASNNGNQTPRNLLGGSPPAIGNSATDGPVGAGGFGLGGEELQRPQQPPIGTPFSKGMQQQRLQQNGTPVLSASTMLYPATADSPASSVSVFDGLSSSLSSQAHSFDDLYTGLLATASSPTSISGGTGSGSGCSVNLNVPLTVNASSTEASAPGASVNDTNGALETVPSPVFLEQPVVDKQ